jgi:CSLREA domain-containing protein
MHPSLARRPPSSPHIARVAVACRIPLAAVLCLASASAPAATFVVTTTADIGDGLCNATECTLREAIGAANLTAAADTINFAIQLPVRGQLLIQPISPLPTITQPVTINGYSQSGTAANSDPDVSNATLRIRLDGVNPGSVRGLAICASNVTIRGLSITRFVQGGVVFGTQSSGTPCANASSGGVVAGNFIGLQGDGTTAAGNQNDSVVVRNAVVRIGGSALADRNVVAAGISSGITLAANVAGSRVENNLIGTDKTGVADRGNAGVGINLDAGVSNVVIGASGSQNLIAHNLYGIRTNGGSGSGMSFFANRIVANDELGIDLGADGAPTANDTNDVDGGANGTQNFPVIDDAVRMPAGVNASMFFQLGHSDTRNYRIALYASSGCDASGHGEGERMIAAQLRGLSTTNQSFTMSALTDPLPPGTVLTATATAPDGSTSEFSRCFFLDPPPLVVNSTADPGNGSCDVAECTLREAITAANATAATADTISFAIGTPASGELLIQPISSLPTITSPLVIDGYTQPGAVANTDPVASNAVPRIRLDGTLFVSPGVALAACADQVTIRGLSITGFEELGIVYGVQNNLSNCATASSGGLIAGNFIGLATDGITAVGNGSGILVGNSASGGASVRVGGSLPAERNVISSNTSNGGGGVIIGSASSPSAIEGNLIGTDRSGLLDRGNAGAGVRIASGASDTLVGTTANPNLIAYNAVGIQASPGAGLGNTWYANRIHDNADLGIDLFDVGVNANDADDEDTGANGLQNFPLLDVAQRSAAGLKIAGTLDVPAGTSGASYVIAVFANAACDGSGHGEGERFLGAQSVALFQTSGEAFEFDLATDDPLGAGTQVTATATAPDGSTSEFSPCVVVSDAPPEVVVNSSADPGTGGCDAGECTLREAISLANTRLGADFIRFDIPGDGPHRIAPSTLLPVITEDLVIDGYTEPGAAPNGAPDGSDAVLMIMLDGQQLRPNLSLIGASGAAVATQVNDSASCSEIGTLKLQGNFIGLRPDGTAAGNLIGVSIANTRGVVGGAASADRNLVSSNTQSGLRIAGAGADGSAVLGNLIGTGPDPSQDRGNAAAGIQLVTTSGLRIGGEAVRANRIAFNGIGLVATGGAANRFAENEFVANDGLGIDLADAGGALGLSANDVDDVDGGANGQQNFPLLESATATATDLTIEGRLDVPAGLAVPQTYRLSFHESASCDPLGHGEGELLLATSEVSLSSNAESFVVTLSIPPSATDAVLTATATDPLGNTSEFSPCFTAPQPGAIFTDGFE